MAGPPTRWPPPPDRRPGRPRSPAAQNRPVAANSPRRSPRLTPPQTPRTARRPVPLREATFLLLRSWHNAYPQRAEPAMKFFGDVATLQLVAAMAWDSRQLNWGAAVAITPGP